jgi:hypothetical protein
MSWPLDERGELGSPTRTRTWIDRLTTGRPTVGRSGNGGAPRTRTELNLLAREIRGPCACPDWLCPGGQTLMLRVHGAMARKGLTPRIEDIGAWGRFRAHLSAASTRRFHQISFPGGIESGAADGNRTRVCAVAPRGSAIELRTRAQSRTRTCGARRHLIYSQASLPLEYLCVVLRMARATSRSPALVFGGRLTVRTPHLAVPTRFRDGLPATPAEPSFFLDVSARFERATSAFGRRRSRPSELRDENP